MPFLTTLVELAGVLLLVFLNGFFVAAEFAIVKVRVTQIEPLARGGSRRARTALHVVRHLDTYLSASQLGITMTSLGLGWAGEPFVAGLLEPVFALIGIGQPAVIRTLSFAFGFSVITFLHIVLGEQAPKWLAIQQARSTTLAIARPLHLFLITFRPFIWLVNASANAFLRAVGIQAAGEGEGGHSEEEIRLLLSKGKAITSLGKDISLRAIQLRDRTVREVMVPRTSVAFLSCERPLEDNIALALDTQFTRYPLCERDLDNVVGMIHLKDLFKLKGEAGEGRRLLDIKREMLFVPESTSLEKTLNTFLGRRVLMAIAVDEYGGTAGLVTLENVLEELVGDIHDEFDVEPAMVQKVGEGEFLVEGGMALHDFAAMFEIVPVSRDVVTVSGYAIQLLGRLPDKGTSFAMGPWTAVVEAVGGRRVTTLRLKRTAHGEAATRERAVPA